ncbi:helix-turn-helix domain-containing protein [Inediibacterium massiliense]|uniref:helix-turn-helix domain-containing protein n=1 Tax=Inediibacterium massiliense TaxID=1658111 RepID=UPI0006B5F51E|nr:AraC family transcriptional regulator [Inediibacterium massiliense]
MEMKKSILDNYYKYIEDKYCCKTWDELLGKKYVIGEEFGIGNFLVLKIEEGLEMARLNLDKMKMDFDNRYRNEDVLEVGYCYSGDNKVLSFPDGKEYTLKEGEIFVYTTLNDVKYFQFIYKNCKTISIHLNFNTIRNVVNPIWEDQVILDWKKNIHSIFKENILIIEKASYELKQIAEQIDDISTDDMMGYMKLKLKTIEFLTTFLEEKSKEKMKYLNGEENEKISQAKEIIHKNIDKVPSVKELAMILNTSIYKLQKWFKNITGDTVYEYIKKVRIEKARYLLENTNMSILQITNEVGYENPSKFASLFKNYHHMTPLQYRKCKNQ